MVGLNVANGNVGFAAHQIVDRVGGDDLDFYAWRDRLELFQSGRQNVSGKNIDSGYPHAAFKRLRLGGRRYGDLVGCRPHGPRLLGQPPSRFGQRQPSSDPLEQQKAKIGFKRCDLSAQRRLG